MEAPDFLVVGHVCRDVVDNGFSIGGTVVYAGLTASKLGRRVAIITSASSDLELASILPHIDIKVVESKESTTFHNTYSKAGRRQVIRSIASPIPVSDIPDQWSKAEIVHLGPVAQELDPALVTLFSSSLVGLTPQGWLRGWDDEGNVSYKEWAGASSILPYIDVLILSPEDVAEDESVIARFSSQVPLLALTQGELGATVHVEGEWHRIPAFPTKVKDRTGAGDVFAAAFLVYYEQTKAPIDAAFFANCVASFCVEQPGISGIPTWQQVRDRLRHAGMGYIVDRLGW